MKKKIIAIVLMICFLGAGGSAYATTSDTANTSLTFEKIMNSAGVLPNSLLYNMERAIEQLQIAITQSEEKLALLKAQFATERAAEVVVMYNEGEEEIASKTMSEYNKMLASAAQHINKAIEAKNEAVQTLQTLNESSQKSEAILRTLLEKAPQSTKDAIVSVLNEQNKALQAVNGFYIAKSTFFAAKLQLEEAKKELETAKRSDDAAVILAAEEKVKAAEAIKDELEGLKDTADTAKEQVKRLVEQAEKRIELSIKQLEKANEKMERLEEKADKELEKLTESLKKADEKAREEAKRIAEQACEEAKRIAEKAREEAKRAAEQDKD